MQYINELVERYPMLSICKAEIESATAQIINAYQNNKKVLVCGNGGSSADADHIVGELMKGFCKQRPLSSDIQNLIKKTEPEKGEEIARKLQTPLRAINLSGHNALSTAFSNDVDPELIYAQLTLGYADKGDVFIGLSTSGNSKNVINASIVAKALGTITIGFTGKNKCEMDNLFDIIIHAPETETYKIQELHLPIYHAICLEFEEHFFC